MEARRPHWLAAGVQQATVASSPRLDSFSVSQQPTWLRAAENKPVKPMPSPKSEIWLTNNCGPVPAGAATAAPPSHTSQSPPARRHVAHGRRSAVKGVMADAVDISPKPLPPSSFHTPSTVHIPPTNHMTVTPHPPTTQNSSQRERDSVATLRTGPALLAPPSLGLSSSNENMAAGGTTQQQPPTRQQGPLPQNGTHQQTTHNHNHSTPAPSSYNPHQAVTQDVINQRQQAPPTLAPLHPTLQPLGPPLFSNTMSYGATSGPQPQQQYFYEAPRSLGNVQQLAAGAPPVANVVAIQQTQPLAQPHNNSNQQTAYSNNTGGLSLRSETSTTATVPVRLQQAQSTNQNPALNPIVSNPALMRTPIPVPPSNINKERGTAAMQPKQTVSVNTNQTQPTQQFTLVKSETAAVPSADALDVQMLLQNPAGGEIQNPLWERRRQKAPPLLKDVLVSKTVDWSKKVKATEEKEKERERQKTKTKELAARTQVKTSDGAPVGPAPAQLILS
eukprot:TRINITY_DN67865_c11_g1_i1.p1 TRINITY_DN67865_c11_g1~~TRINITY_DN67865_c11_g1_i1.p1  ORF type:complete len:503 (-),score=48.69 TRINITY_DN67865_c11_g1_i1:245-1753(-)